MTNQNDDSRRGMLPDDNIEMYIAGFFGAGITFVAGLALMLHSMINGESEYIIAFFAVVTVATWIAFFLSVQPLVKAIAYIFWKEGVAAKERNAKITSTLR